MIAWHKDGQGYFDFSKMDAEQIIHELRTVNLERDSKRINVVAYQESHGVDSIEYAEALSWKEKWWTALSVKKYQLCRELVDRGFESYEGVLEEIQGEIDVLLNLSETGMTNFAEVHRKHVAAWESKERIKQHSLSNIQKVKWDRNEKCFKVYYKKTKQFSSEWYHYTLSGIWY